MALNYHDKKRTSSKRWEYLDKLKNDTLTPLEAVAFEKILVQDSDRALAEGDMMFWLAIIFLMPHVHKVARG